nr:amidohydrolase [Bacillus piscicola]
MKGRSLLPGFIDAHAHIEINGTNKLGVNCKELPSIAEIQTALRERAQDTPTGEWIRGWGYNHKQLSENRHPTRAELDEVSVEHPIIITRTCNHTSVVNSKALALFGLADDAPDPEGGRLGRENGRLNGQLFESIHMAMFEFSQYEEEEIMKGYQLASQEYIENGITSLHEAGGYGNVHFQWLQKGVLNQFIDVRLYMLMGSLSRSKEVLERALEGGFLTKMGNDRFTVGPAKLFIDGSSSGPTAATREPYTSDPHDSGVLYYTQEELEETLVKASRMGNQITSHAMGDKGVEMLITCIEKANEVADSDRRHRIEHCGIAQADLRERIKKAKAVPILNPAFLYEFGDGYLVDYGERVHDMFPARSLLDLGVRPAIGSDNPVTTANPFIGIYAAVTRKTKSGKEIGTNQRVTIYEAIEQYTINGAFASYKEDDLGSIEPGKTADLIIVNQPILDVDPEEVKNVKVDATMIGGIFYYQRSSSESYTRS